MDIDVVDREGRKIESLRLTDGLFPTRINRHLLFLATKAFLDNQRQGTAKTKTRSEVRGGGKKPWRQKGTGRARHGTIRSPLWKGGGIVFGPQPRDYSHSLSKKEKKAALYNALAWVVHENKLRVVDTIVLEEQKTRLANEFLKALDVRGKVLIVTEDLKKDQFRAFANLPTVCMVPRQDLNTYLLLEADTVLMERGAITSLQEVFHNES